MHGCRRHSIKPSLVNNKLATGNDSNDEHSRTKWHKERMGSTWCMCKIDTEYRIAQAVQNPRAHTNIRLCNMYSGKILKLLKGAKLLEHTLTLYLRLCLVFTYNRSPTHTQLTCKHYLFSPLKYYFINSRLLLFEQ